jgi:hypothetical protein
MTDPDRIAKRSSGLAAELLRAGAEEQPGGAGMERTLAALGISGAALTATAAANASAAAGAAGVTAATAAKIVTVGVVAKWVGVGVVSGVVLSGAAALVSSPAPSASAAPARVHAAPSVVPASSVVTPARVEQVAVAPAPPVEAPAPVVPSALQRAVPPAPSEPEPRLEAPLEVGAPLAAEVAFIDGARALLASGRAEQGLTELRRYEQEFPEARLLPEVLFLRLETCDRLGRAAEARSAATRLLEGFPKSPHAARARRLLGQ